MGFISYNLKYFNDELQKAESGVVTEASVYRIKQLLKMLDDLADEGYTELNGKLEEAFSGVSRIRKYLERNHTEPFKLCRIPLFERDITYDPKDSELTEAIDNAIEKAGHTGETSDNKFLGELIRFCEWVGYEEDTAYIFLLRDTLLPYIHYRSKGRKNIYPWLLGRKALAFIAGKECVDDEIRASIIKGLEYGHCNGFNEFCDIVLPGIKETLKRYPEVENTLSGLLDKIKEKRIIVVESGCSGTFPMLLMSMDKRINIHMYTTYPYLLDIYGDKIYTSKYEENRSFETLFSQDIYFRFSRFNDGRFYVNKCDDSEVEEKALAEIKTILR